MRKISSSLIYIYYIVHARAEKVKKKTGERVDKITVKAYNEIEKKENVMENYRKIDMHVHSSGMSLCSRVSVEEIVDCKKRLGYDGAVLVNHCQSWYYPKDEHKSFMEKLIKEYERGKAYADRQNFLFLLGVEVTIVDPFYSDWLLYGGEKDAFLRSPCLYELNQKQLFAFCEENDILLLQAHCYRPNAAPNYDMRPADPAYMHGLEVNCDKRDVDNRERCHSFAEEHGKILTCGTDYHHANNEYRGGTYLPDWVKTNADLKKYLRGTDKTFYFMEEKNFVCKIKK